MAIAGVSAGACWWRRAMVLVTWVGDGVIRCKGAVSLPAGAMTGWVSFTAHGALCEYGAEVRTVCAPSPAPQQLRDCGWRPRDLDVHEGAIQFDWALRFYLCGRAQAGQSKI